MKYFILFLLLFFTAPAKAFTPKNEFCYTTLTVESDLYIPGIAGYSVTLEYIDLETWQITRVTDSGLSCSGRLAFGFVYLPDIRGINYQGDALFLLQGDILKLIPFVGPTKPTGY